MAYINQDDKRRIRKVIDSNLKEAGFAGRVKFTMGIRRSLSLYINIKSSDVDLLAGSDSTYKSVNPYHYKSHFDGEARELLKAIITGMNDGNHDNSDPMTDYFDVGWYIDVNIGRWDKPFEYTGA